MKLRSPESLRETIKRRTQRGTNGSCLIWTGATDSDGYPKTTVGKTPNGYQKLMFVHRVNWELLNGPIPDGQELARVDHCLNRRCIAPEHLELSKRGTAGHAMQSFRRATETHFSCGHERTAENSAWHKGRKHFYCRECSRVRSRERCRRWRERHPDRVAAYRDRQKTEQLGLAA